MKIILREKKENVATFDTQAGPRAFWDPFGCLGYSTPNGGRRLRGSEDSVTGCVVYRSSQGIGTTITGEFIRRVMARMTLA